VSRPRPLNGLDALFLHLESARTPMHMGSVAVFEGGPLTDAAGRVRIEKLRTGVEDRLDLVPNLRRRPRSALFGEAGPVWVDDGEFDLAAHMRVVRLPAPGTFDQLAALSAEILAVPLDLGRPLWEMWFVEGLAGARVGLIQKLHHALADGLGGVELATILLDAERHPRRPHPAHRSWYPEPVPDALSIGAFDASARVASVVRGARLVLRRAVHPVPTLRAGWRLADALSTLATPAVFAPRSPINAPIGQARRVAFVRVSLASLVGVERAFGVTVNDVVLSAVAGGLRRMLLERGEDARGELQALVPVGASHADHALGNRVSAMLGRLPIGVADPVARLQAVGTAMARVKAHHQDLAAAALLGELDPLPQSVLGTIAWVVHHQPLVNVVVTNVPGTPFPLYAHGARMLEVYPIVPLGGNLTVGVAALSYDGQMHIGLYADRDRCPDLQTLADGMRQSFAEMIGAAGVDEAPAGHDGHASDHPRTATNHPPRPRGAPKGPAPAGARAGHGGGARR